MKTVKVNVLAIASLLFILALSHAESLQVFQQRVVVNSSELCIIPITPSLLGWEKKPGSIKEIEYSARMSNSPDLPEWLKYSYDSRTSTGYIYGVPPIRLVTLNLDVIGWNRYDNNDVRQLIVSLEIMRKEPLEFMMEMKIDNVNIRDLCVPRRMNNLTNILAEHLGWRQKNSNKVVPIYMASAVDIGANRVPLRPNEAEGVVIHFASDKDFSPILKKLQVEISPLLKLRPCPRDMKRTSVERYFRRSSFLVDWCSFRLVSPNGMSTDEEKIGSQSGSSGSSTGNSDGAVDETMDFVNGKGRFAIQPEVFHFESDIPERSYSYEALMATIIPGSIGGLVGIVLITLLWADREDESVYNDGNGNGSVTYSYHQINRQQQPPQDDSMLISRDAGMKPNPILEHQVIPGSSSGAASMMMERELASTPLPPQYSETHPNGAPALIYAV